MRLLSDGLFLFVDSSAQNMNLKEKVSLQLQIAIINCYGMPIWEAKSPIMKNIHMYQLSRYSTWFDAG